MNKTNKNQQLKLIFSILLPVFELFKLNKNQRERKSVAEVLQSIITLLITLPKAVLTHRLPRVGQTLEKFKHQNS